MDNLANSFGLQIGNNSMNDWENHWTFRSSLGVKRRIDFIMTSKSLHLQECQATKNIDLGSDHRAVKGRFGLGSAKYTQRSPNMKMKGWKLVLHDTGNATNFQVALSQELVQQDTSKSEVLEQALYNAATAMHVKKASYDRTKPWESIEIQILLQQRRECTTPLERRNISKTI